MKTTRTLTLTKASDVPMEPRRARPGNVWTYDPKVLTLTYRPMGYQIDVETCTSSAEVLDWICQIYKKHWVTEQVVFDLVEQFNVILDPQSTLCSGGHEQGPLAVKQHLRALKGQ